MTDTVRLTVAQAVVRFLACQYTERDGVTQRLFAGCFGIFGHGNVAGIGQALLQAEVQTLEGDADAPDLPYILVRNEQGAVHAASAYAKTRNRLQTWAVTSSTGRLIAVLTPIFIRRFASEARAVPDASISQHPLLPHRHFGPSCA